MKFSNTSALAGAAMLTAVGSVDSQSLYLEPVPQNSGEISNTIKVEEYKRSPSYLEFRSRVSSVAKDNSISILLLSRVLSGRDINGNEFDHILKDHEDRISALVSYERGNTTITVKTGINAQVGVSPLIRSLGGAHVNAGYDTSLIYKGGELVSNNSRVASQTGIHQYIGENRIGTKDCIHGGVGINVSLGVSAALGGNVETCYEADPGTMTALGLFETRNQKTLSVIEKGIGNDFEIVVNALYNQATQCITPIGKTQCSAIDDLLKSLGKYNMGVNLPRNVKTGEEIQREGITNSDIINAINDLEEGLLIQEGNRIIQEKSILTDVHRTLLEQGKILEVLSDPNIQTALLQRALVEAGERVKSLEHLQLDMLDLAKYDDLTPNDRLIKLQIEVAKIEQGSHEFQTYLDTSAQALTLIAILADSPEMGENIRKAYTILANANELIKTTLIIQELISNEDLTSVAGATAVGGWIGAAIAIVKIAITSGSKSEIESLVDYLNKQFEGVHLRFDALEFQNQIMSEQLDMILTLQQDVYHIVRSNSQAIESGRIEVAFLQKKVDQLFNLIELNYNALLGELSTAHKERTLYYDKSEESRQALAISETQAAFNFWFNEDSHVIGRLNDGKISEGFLDLINSQRATVKTLIDRLGGVGFIQSYEVVSNYTAPEYRLPHELISGMQVYSIRANEVIEYGREGLSPNFSSFSKYSADYDEVITQAEEIHNSQFPLAESDRFANLSNPDFLSYVTGNYIAFAMSLNPEIRERLGFSDLISVVNKAKRLVTSRKEAQEIVWPLFSGVKYGLGETLKDLDSVAQERNILNTDSGSLIILLFPEINFPSIYSSQSKIEYLREQLNKGPRQDFTPGDINFIANFLSKPIIDQNTKDWEKLLMLFPSNASLLEFAENEDIIQSYITGLGHGNEVSKTQVGEVLFKDTYYGHNGTFSYGAPCPYAQVVSTDNVLEGERYLFPYDMSVINHSFESTAHYCQRLAEMGGVIHPSLLADYGDGDFIHVQPILSGERSINEYLEYMETHGEDYRRANNFTDKYPIYLRTKNVCQVNYRWNLRDELSNILTGYRTGEDMANTELFNIYTLDNPRLWPSHGTANSYNEAYTASTPRFTQQCGHREVPNNKGASFSTYSGKAIKGAHKPPHIVNNLNEWVDVDEHNNLSSENRTLLIQALIKEFERRKELQSERVGQEFQRIQREESRQFHSVLYGPISLKVFADWGLGECLYQVPQYRQLSELFNGPNNIFEVLNVFMNPNSTGADFIQAYRNIGDIDDRINNQGDSLNQGIQPSFPWPLSDDNYQGVDGEAMINLSSVYNCEAGHSTINQLEKYIQTIERYLIKE